MAWMARWVMRFLVVWLVLGVAYVGVWMRLSSAQLTESAFVELGLLALVTNALIDLIFPESP